MTGNQIYWIISSNTIFFVVSPLVISDDCANLRSFFERGELILPKTLTPHVPIDAEAYYNMSAYKKGRISKITSSMGNHGEQTDMMIK